MQTVSFGSEVLLAAVGSEGPVERYGVAPDGLERLVRRRSGAVFRSLMAPASAIRGPSREVTSSQADHAWLTSPTPPTGSYSGRDGFRVVDLFAGCGGLSLGVAEACRAVGIRFDCVMALDFDKSAAAVYAVNFPQAKVVVNDVALQFDGEVGAASTSAERNLKTKLGAVDLLAGGPPCQGHSDFNNRTRRHDRKNELYLRMVRAAEVLEPESVLIENVPGALNDRASVVQRAASRLTSLGYAVDLTVVDASELGIAQRRRRLVLLASKTRAPKVAEALLDHSGAPTDVRWAIGDLVGVDAVRPLDTPARSAPVTRRRIEYLFAHDLHDLPNSQRPPCHASGSHSYSSIYGRLHWDRPAPTITTGFYSMCMGRYVHPSEPRTITAHEAARIQHFPDWFNFDRISSRTDLATMIGNAVPPKLAYVLALDLLR